MDASHSKEKLTILEVIVLDNYVDTALENRSTGNAYTWFQLDTQ